MIGRVDGVLIVSRLGATTSDAARRLASELRGLNAPVLGIVANGLRSRAQAYYYGYEPDRVPLPPSPGCRAASAAGAAAGPAADRAVRPRGSPPGRPACTSR